jgi:hypothetical protein
MGIWIAVGVVVLLLVLFVVNANRKMIVIAEPRLGFLNLIGPSGEEMMKEDRDAIGPIFFSRMESQSGAPACDVLFIYATVTTEGTLEGTEQSLREIISDACAKVVVVANANPSENYNAALKREGEGRANIVFTIDRRGCSFALFFSRLFETMAKRISMPVAWVRLAPQRPGEEHPDCPGTIFVCEAGQVAFKRLT